MPHPVASLLLTTEAVIAQRPDPQSAAASSGEGMGMGGM
jgi:hypothetical protein